MTSEKKAEANRRNALKSTGPKTPEGKAAIRLNALKHGLLSREMLLSGEDGGALRELAEGLRAELQPVRELENLLLVDRITSLLWRLRRLGRVEAAPGLVHHSDRGVQYTSLSLSKKLEEEGLIPSMGRVGSAYDNALAESFVATLKTELLYRNAWPTRQAVRAAIFEYVEGFYNLRRRHSALGHLSLAEFEEVILEEQYAA